VERYLTLVDGVSDKFWSVVCNGRAVTVTYGRNGTAGQTRARTYATEAEASDDAEKLVRAKLQKGYSDSASSEQADEDEGTAYFRESVRSLVRPGFVTLGQALESLLEQAEDDPAIALDEAQADLIVRAEWALREKELAGVGPGDEVRIEAAFESLREANYVAEMNVGYTKQDAWPELGDRVKRTRAKGLVFFHGQDAARLAESPADLYLGFDCESGDDTEMLAVGRAAVDAMTAQGLTVAWDGSASTRVLVKDLTWRRPLPN